MDAIKALSNRVWRYHRNNPARVRCPVCDGTVWPASGTVSAVVGTRTAQRSAPPSRRKKPGRWSAVLRAGTSAPRRAPGPPGRVSLR